MHRDHMRAGRIEEVSTMKIVAVPTGFALSAQPALGSLQPR
jgi:hypothetical protein